MKETINYKQGFWKRYVQELVGKYKSSMNNVGLVVLGIYAFWQFSSSSCNSDTNILITNIACEITFIIAAFIFGGGFLYLLLLGLGLLFSKSISNEIEGTHDSSVSGIVLFAFPFAIYFTIRYTYNIFLGNGLGIFDMMIGPGLLIIVIILILLSRPEKTFKMTLDTTNRLLDVKHLNKQISVPENAKIKLMVYLNLFDKITGGVNIDGEISLQILHEEKVYDTIYISKDKRKITQQRYWEWLIPIAFDVAQHLKINFIDVSGYTSQEYKVEDLKNPLASFYKSFKPQQSNTDEDIYDPQMSKNINSERERNQGSNLLENYITEEDKTTVETKIELQEDFLDVSWYSGIYLQSKLRIRIVLLIFIIYLVTFLVGALIVWISGNFNAIISDSLLLISLIVAITYILRYESRVEILRFDTEKVSIKVQSRFLDTTIVQFNYPELIAIRSSIQDIRGLFHFQIVTKNKVFQLPGDFNNQESIIQIKEKIDEFLHLNIHFSDMVDFEIEEYYCHNCGALQKEKHSFCHNCNDVAPRCFCFIAPQKGSAVTRFECCHTDTHYNHGKTWVERRDFCPYCKQINPEISVYRIPELL